MRNDPYLKTLTLCWLLAAPQALCASGFLASAGKADITPSLERTVYVAGYGSKGRPATGVHDPLWARGIALQKDKATVVLVNLDLIGFPRPYVERIREGFDGVYILVASAHTHSGPDTLGLWGPKMGHSGVDPVYIDLVIDRTRSLIKGLLKDLRPAKLTAAQTDVDPKGLTRDLRDPVVIDDTLTAIKIVASATGAPIATLVNWSCHPEVLGPDNTLITSDFPHYLRARIESSSKGTAVFFAGSIGGLLSPDASADTFSEAERIGTSLAEHALKALMDKSVSLDQTTLTVSTAAVRLPVENILYLAVLKTAAHGRPIFDAHGRRIGLPYWSHWPGLLKPLAAWLHMRILRGKAPWLESEMALVRFGDRLSILAVPGELFPELYLGGYDGSKSFQYDVTSKHNPRPPDLKRAPTGGYLKDRMDTRLKLVFGLANDEIGYIVPEYDFRINKLSPFLYPRPKGHHYEETNSVGSQAAKLIVETAGFLIDNGHNTR